MAVALGDCSTTTLFVVADYLFTKHEHGYMLKEQGNSYIIFAIYQNDSKHLNLEWFGLGHDCKNSYDMKKGLMRQF